MINPVVVKLGLAAELTEHDRTRLQALTARARRIGPRAHIVPEGQAPETVHFMVEGLACCYRTLPDGSRQITAYLAPGDVVGLQALALGQTGYGVCSFGPCLVAEAPAEALESLGREAPGLLKALWRTALVEAAIAREWLVNMGQRPADRRMAHLFCEILFRLRAVQRTRGPNSFDFPLTQEELGDTLGLSVVHANRVLQSLREAGLVTLRNKVLSVLDEPKLIAFAGFNPDYLGAGPVGRSGADRNILGPAELV